MSSCECSRALTVVIAHLLLLTAASAQCAVAKLQAPDAMDENRHGISVSMSDNVVVIGAPRDHDAGSFSGAAYVYRLDASEWIEEVKLTASDAAQGDRFGSAVGVSGDVAVVGAYNTDNNGPLYGSGFGTAYVYRFDGSEWIEEDKLTASDAASGDHFGLSVAVSGNVAVVGAPGADEKGSAYVFRFDGGEWTQEAELTAPGIARFDAFGGHVATDGNVVVVGMPDGHFLSEDCGAAFVYRFNGAGWFREDRLEAPDCDAQDHFGAALSVSGDVLFVGASNEGDVSPTTDDGHGATHVFRYVGAQWMHEQRLVAFDAETGDRFGWSVSVHDGLAAVGARYHDHEGDMGKGAVYVYRLEKDQWVFLDKLTPSESVLGDYFGDAVAVSGRAAVIGMPNQHACYCVPGSAFVVTLTHGCSSIPDYAGFQNCFGRSDGGLTPECVAFDVEPDNDIDLDDFADFPISLTGP